MNYAVRTTDLCNLDCEYCYAKTDDPHSMNMATLRKVLTNIILHEDPAKVSDITINWTGGEPMLQGIEFFKEIIEIQSVFTDINWTNVIQTNLTLLNTDWSNFLADNNFQVRTSLDLPRHNHAARRSDNNFNETMFRIRLLQDAGVSVNVNTVITSQNIHKAEEIYDFLQDHSITRFSMSRFVLQGNAVDHTELLLTEKGAFGKFLIELFDLWVNDPDTITVKMTPLENLINACTFHLNQVGVLAKPCFHCQDQIFAINPRGHVYPSCNKFLAHEDTCFGNLHNDTMEEILNSDKRKAFLEQVEDAKGKVCTTCTYADICKGGCFFLAYQFNEDNPDREDFCKGYYFVFEHIIKHLKGAMV